MKKEIVVNKNNNEVTICLSLKKRIMARDPRMTITTKMVQTMLENDDFKLDKCISHDTIDNHDNNSKHDGTWIFSLFVLIFDSFFVSKMVVINRASIGDKPGLL